MRFLQSIYCLFFYSGKEGKKNLKNQLNYFLKNFETLKDKVVTLELLGRLEIFKQLNPTFFYNL